MYQVITYYRGLPEQSRIFQSAQEANDFLKLAFLAGIDATIEPLDSSEKESEVDL